ncbi:hypothetical protein BLCJPOBP_00033 [Klebsiella phage vB_KpP-Yoda]|nr:hypothetical protein BLCJPOBP_00033 [Klebsiella phage vB_KpP-Yoda]
MCFNFIPTPVTLNFSRVPKPVYPPFCTVQPYQRYPFLQERQHSIQERPGISWRRFYAYPQIYPVHPTVRAYAEQIHQIPGPTYLLAHPPLWRFRVSLQLACLAAYPLRFLVLGSLGNHAHQLPVLSYYSLNKRRKVILALAGCPKCPLPACPGPSSLPRLLPPRE